MAPDLGSLEAAFSRGDADALYALLGFRPALYPSGPDLDATELAQLALAAHATAAPALAFGRAMDVADAVTLPVAQWHPSGRGALLFGVAASQAAARYLRQNASEAGQLVSGEFVEQPKLRGDFDRDVSRLRAAADTDDDFAASLRRYRVTEWSRIVCREAAHFGDVRVILTELSDLADAIINAATAWALRRERSQNGPRLALVDDTARGAGFSVIAQGKLGGRELNVSSDVDLQYFYSRDEAADATLSLHERFASVAQQITALLGQPGPEGFAYRVDLDLRPEGTKGAVVNSIDAAESYYETWGQGWERLALIRARHVGGAPWVSRAFLSAVRPFVFPRSLDARIVDETQRMMERVRVQRRVGAYARGRDPGFDLKRDPGGIREIEMFVQIQQLLHGGREIMLRDPSILAALDALQFVGAVSWDDHAELQDAYRFWRGLENSIQAVDDLQTQRVPHGEQGDVVAIIHDVPDRAALLEKMEQTAERVRKITQPLFAADETTTTDPQVRALLNITQDESEQAALFAELGFAAPLEATTLLSVLRAGLGGPFSSHAKERVRELAAPLLEEIAHAPDPDLALRHYVELDRRLRRQPHYYELFAAEPVRRRLVDLLGASELFARTVTWNPELLDWLAQARDRDHLGRRRGVELLEERAREHTTAALRDGGDAELQLRRLRQLKLQECLRVGILDLADALDTEEVLLQLTDVAEALLRATLELLTSAGSKFVVLGLGSLGASEFGYGSDLDLIFLYEPPGRGDDGEARQNAVRLAQRLIRYVTLALPEGQLYTIDARLRPSGNQGPLVTSAAAFVDYQKNRAMLWERQALLRARPVAGDLSLGERVLTALDDVRYPRELDDGAASEIYKLRERMEAELAPARGGTSLKSGRGGLIDVEFAAQLLVMRHGHTHPAARCTGTLASLRALGDAGILDEPQVQACVTAYSFIKKLENRLRMVRDRGIDALDFAHFTARALAKRMGYRDDDGVQELKRDWEQAQRDARAFYDATFEA